MSEDHHTVICDKEPNKRKRNWNGRKTAEEEDDECNITSLDKLYNYKRVLLSLTKPSYLLGLGSTSLRPQNRVRLCLLLRKLVRQHNWVDASGVLAILLKGTRKDNHPTINRFKYLVSMELIKHLETEDMNLTLFDEIYDTWMTRIGINLSKKRKRNRSVEEDSFVVRLESILFRFMQGNIESERQNARSLMQESEFEGYPMFDTIIGLIFFQLCYSSIPEDMKLKHSDPVCSLSCTDLSVTPELDASATRFRGEIGGSEGHNAVFSDESESSLQSGSETSVMNGKRLHVEVKNELQRELVPMEIDVNLQRNAQRDFQPQGFYVHSAENEVSADNNGSHIYLIPSLAAIGSRISWLLPLRTQNWELEWLVEGDEYNHAVRYLQAAVYSTTPALAALVPLLQLLLMGCKFKEALDELERFCENSNAALPARLKAHLLELLDPNNAVALSSCFEDTLKIDPTSTESLDKLINLHQIGNYRTDSLLEMIAMHLDAVCGEYKTWREFALCFLKVSQYEEDCMSVCFHGEKSQHDSVRYNRIPSHFIRGKSGKAWRLRCRWWLTRHFSKNILSSDIASGNLELLTYKAACASHMYGPEFNYVIKAYNCLENRKSSSHDFFIFLQLHMHNSTGLDFSLGNQNK